MSIKFLWAANYYLLFRLVWLGFQLTFGELLFKILVLYLWIDFLLLSLNPFTSNLKLYFMTSMSVIKCTPLCTGF